MSTRWVAVDDQDPSILYGGDWSTSSEQFGGILNPFGPVYMGSQYATRTGGSMEFTFEGSQVQLYGTNHQTNTSTLVDPVWECSVDGVPYQPESGIESKPINQWPLCLIDLKGSGKHTFVVEAKVTLGTFYVDQIMYRPSPDLRNSLHPTVYLFHSDSAIKYSEGDWVTHEGNKGRLTQTIGAKMKVAFNGTKATWIGRLPRGFPLQNSTATYSIDGDDPIEFNIMGLLHRSDELLYWHPYFETPKLSQGEHTLEVVYKGDGAPLLLEYFLVDNSDIVQPSGLVLQFNKAKKGSPAGAIVGGVVGGLVVLAIIATLVFLYWRKKKERGAAEVDLRSSVVHTPHMDQKHLPPATVLTAQTSGTPTYSSSGGGAAEVGPRFSVIHPPHMDQTHPSTALFTAQSSGTPMFSTSNTSSPPVPSTVKMSVTPAAHVSRPSPGSGPPSPTSQHSSSSPYDLGLLGLAGGRDSLYHPVMRGTTGT